ncbi:MAG TPA: right-handed parallel beta-helix repeat-containing protein [Kiritimatiellia bacterium]|nr:right-handed parallel beta-helix repeat-containing protein [Kiritimatiellia bacterium]
MRVISLCAGALLLAMAADAAPGHFPFSAQPLASLHVATNGNDTTGNGSLGLPFRTLGRAAQGAVPGTEIVLLPGIHTPGAFIYDLHGSTSHPIWIRGANPTNRPLINGGSEGVHLVRARHVMIKDLEIANASANGLNCDDGGAYTNPNASAFLVFSNLVIRDIGGGGNQDGIKLSGIRDFYIFDVDIARCGGAGSGSGIDMVGCHRGLIEGGVFRDLSGNAIQAKGGTTDIEIRRCVFSNAGHRALNIGGSTGFEFFRPPLSSNQPNAEARDIRVFSSVFIGATATVAFAGSVDCIVANNTIIEPTRWVFRILQETTTSGSYVFQPCSSNIFRNNIVYYRHDTLNRYVNEGADTDPASFRVDHNLWFAYDNPAAPGYALPGITTNNRIGLNPQFAAAASNDYRITAASPAATQGLHRAGAPPDFDGVSYLTPPSLGAFELSGDTDLDALPDYWELASFTTLVHTAASDPDGDGVNNGAEYGADTNPLDPASHLAFTEWTWDDGGLRVAWKGGVGAQQWVERNTGWPTAVWVPIATLPPPTAPTNSIAVPADSATAFRLRAARP